MGAGIAICFLDHGYRVTLIESSEEALGRGINRISQHYQEAQKKGRLDSGQVSSRTEALRGGVDYHELSSVDLIVEAVFEDLKVKREVF